jgi:hypothetical protein
MVQAKSSFELLCSAFHHIAAESHSLQWILVVTEDTFAMPENLRSVLSDYFFSVADFNDNKS